MEHISQGKKFSCRLEQELNALDTFYNLFYPWAIVWEIFIKARHSRDSNTHRINGSGADSYSKSIEISLDVFDNPFTSGNNTRSTSNRELVKKPYSRIIDTTNRSTTFMNTNSRVTCNSDMEIRTFSGYTVGNNEERKRGSILERQSKRIRNLKVSTKEEFCALIKRNSCNGKTIKSIDFGCFMIPYPLRGITEYFDTSDIIDNQIFTRIDIDLDDYKLAREDCCKALKRVCRRCWKIASCVMMTLEYIATQIFGLPLDNVIFIYSGNKGIHSYIFGISSDRFYSLVNSLREHPNSKNTNCGSNDNEYLESNVRIHILEKFLLPCYSYLFTDVFDINDHNEFELLKVSDNGYYDRELVQLVYDTLFVKYDKAIEEQSCHLMKTPLGLHPVTLNFCCVIPNNEISSFTPNLVPKWLDITPTTTTTTDAAAKTATETTTIYDPNMGKKDVNTNRGISDKHNLTKVFTDYVNKSVRNLREREIQV